MYHSRDITSSTGAHRVHTLRAAACMLCQTMGIAPCMSVRYSYSLGDKELWQ